MAADVADHGSATIHRYLSPVMVCELVPGMTVEQLMELWKDGRGAACRKPTGARGKLVIYAEAEVREWIEAARVGTRDQP